MSDPFRAVRDFEAALCDYTGAKYAVTTNSCTMALTLAVAWHVKSMKRRTVSGYVEGIPVGARIGEPQWFSLPPEVEIPKRTYVSVPMAIIHAGGKPTFRDENWLGAYALRPLPVWDSARYFTSGLFNDSTSKPIRSCAGSMVCVSFHASKTLGDSQGGAILHDNDEADAWLRKARFDGRTEGVAPKDDRFDMIGYHCYLSPDVAARLLHKLHHLPKHNEPLPNDDYPDLSQLEIFR